MTASVQAQFARTFSQIKRGVNASMGKFAEKLAVNVANKSKEYALNRTRDTTGKLADNITAYGIITRTGYYRYDVTTNVPYSAWIEFGAGAPIGLPYSSPAAQAKYNKDYSQSSYRGIKFLSDASLYWSDTERCGQLFAGILFKNLKGI